MKILKLLLGAGSGHLIAITLTPFFMSVYSPENFGEYALYIALSGLLLGFSCLRFDAVILVCKSSEVLQVFKTGIAFNLLLLGLVFVIAKSMNYPQIYFFLVSLFGQSLLLISSSLFLRFDNYLLVSILKFIFTAGIPIFQLIITITFKENGLIIGHFLASLLLITILIYYLTQHFKWPNTHKVKILSKYSDFYTINTPSVLLNSLSSQFLPISINFFFGEAVLGAINVLQRVFITPVTFTLRIVLQFYNKEITTMINVKAYANAYQFLLKTMTLSLVSTIIFVGISSFLFDYFKQTHYFQGEWSKITNYFFPFLVLLVIQGTTIPISQTLTFIHKHSLQLRIELLRILLLSFLVIAFLINNYGAEKFINIFILVQSTIYIVLTAKIIQTFKRL